MLYKKLWNPKKNDFSRNSVVFLVFFKRQLLAGYPTWNYYGILAPQLIRLIIFITCLGPFDAWLLRLKKDYKVEYICFWTYEKYNLPFLDALILTV